MSIQIDVVEAPPRARTPDYRDAFAVGRATSDARSAEPNLAMRVEANRAVLSTFVHYTKPTVAGAIFAGAGPIHRAIIHYLLNRAADLG